MKFVILGFLLAVLLLPSAFALEISDYNITFGIMADGTVKESVSMDFADPLNASTLNYLVLGEISDLTINNGEQNINYTIEKVGNEYDVKFVVPEGTEKLTISFVAKDLVFFKENIYSFFTNLRPPASKRVTVTAYLPMGFAVYSNVIYPKGCQILTDGERIYLKWDFENPGEIAISFKFYNTYNDYSLAVAVTMAVALVIVAAYLIYHYKKKVKREFVRGFSEDERKVLLILSKNKTCMQNKFEKELKFSRAKMTRVVKKLEAKGLVEKEKVGRTNRLHYKK